MLADTRSPPTSRSSCASAASPPTWSRRRVSRLGWTVRRRRARRAAGPYAVRRRGAAGWRVAPARSCWTRGLLLDERSPASPALPHRLIADLGTVLRQDRVTTVLVTHHRGEAQAWTIAWRCSSAFVSASSTRPRVFHAPASEDVARFVGVETIVTGRVIGREAGVTRVGGRGRTLEAAAPAESGARVDWPSAPKDVTLVLAARSTATPRARATCCRLDRAHHRHRHRRSRPFESAVSPVATVTRARSAAGTVEGMAVNPRSSRPARCT